jgi:hypothetical protein
MNRTWALFVYADKLYWYLCVFCNAAVIDALMSHTILHILVIFVQKYKNQTLKDSPVNVFSSQSEP